MLFLLSIPLERRKMVNIVKVGKIKLQKFVSVCKKRSTMLKFNRHTRKFYVCDMYFNEHSKEIDKMIIHFDGLLTALQHAFYPFQKQEHFKNGRRSSNAELGKQVDDELDKYVRCLRAAVSRDFEIGELPSREWLEGFSSEFYSRKRKLSYIIGNCIGSRIPFHPYTKRLIKHFAENGIYLLDTQIPLISQESGILTYIDAIGFSLLSGKTFLLEIKTGFDRKYENSFDKSNPFFKYQCLHTSKNITASEKNKHQLQLGFMWAISQIINSMESPFDECQVVLVNGKNSSVKVYPMEPWFKREWPHMLYEVGFDGLSCGLCIDVAGKTQEQKKITDFFSTK